MLERSTEQNTTLAVTNLGFYLWLKLPSVVQTKPKDGPQVSGERRQTPSRDVFAQRRVGADGARRELVMPSGRCWRLCRFLPVPHPSDVCQDLGFGKLVWWGLPTPVF